MSHFLKFNPNWIFEKLLNIIFWSSPNIKIIRSFLIDKTTNKNVFFFQTKKNFSTISLFILNRFEKLKNIWKSTNFQFRENIFLKFKTVKVRSITYNDPITQTWPLGAIHCHSYFLLTETKYYIISLFRYYKRSL